MSLTYATTISTISTMTAIPPTNDDFEIVVPSMIDYAEGRIYRELNMLTEDVRDGSASTSASNRNFTIPTGIGTFQIVTGVNIITPASTAPESGARNPCTPVSRDVLDMIYPSADSASMPTMFNYFSQSSLSGQPSILFGPWPDAAYRVEVVGKIIPTPLSASNTTTFLTLYLPDLFIAACMIFVSGYMKNFGAQSDDPKGAQSWEAQYQTLLKSAADWEARKRFAGGSWTSQAVEPTAVPQRG